MAILVHATAGFLGCPLVWSHNFFWVIVHADNIFNGQYTIVKIVSNEN